MTRSRLLVLGAAGMLGHKLLQVASAGHDVFGTVRTAVPGLASLAGVADDHILAGVNVAAPIDEVLAHLRPDAVINCTGVLKPTTADIFVEDAIEINALAPHRLARACALAGVRFVQVSTDCVFAGLRGGYRETDTADATDIYGRTKSLGEVTYGNAVTVRTSIIGRQLSGDRGLVEWFLSRRHQAVSGFTQAWFSGLTTAELARVLVGVATGAMTGLYHVAGPPISKHDLITLLNDRFLVGADIHRVDQPRIDRTLDGAAFAAATGYVAPSWDAMLAELSSDPTPYATWRNRAS